MTAQTHHISVRRTARYATLGVPLGDEPVEQVWFVLHGYSQLARHFIRWFEPAVRPGRLIVAPEALSRAYFEGSDRSRRVGASWMTKEDREAEIEDYVRYLDDVADVVLAGVGHTVRVEMHGFSQGGAAAARWATYGRRTADRLVLWGSTLPPDLEVERLRPRLGTGPLVLAIGDRDHYISQDQVRAELARLNAIDLPVQFLAFGGGHTVDRNVLSQIGG